MFYHASMVSPAHDKATWHFQREAGDWGIKDATHKTKQQMWNKQRAPTVLIYAYYGGTAPLDNPFNQPSACAHNILYTCK